MKSLRIEFIDPYAWRVIWAVAGVLAGAVSGYVAWQGSAASREVAVLATQLDAIQNQLSTRKLSKPANVAPQDLSNAKAIMQLQFDPNKVFAVLENVDVPGTRLTGFNLDATADILRIEYSMETPAKASEVTDALNQGYEKRPWRLDRVTSTAASTNISAIQTGTAPMTVAGTWSSRGGSL